MAQATESNGGGTAAAAAACRSAPVAALGAAPAPARKRTKASDIDLAGVQAKVRGAGKDCEQTYGGGVQCEQLQSTEQLAGHGLGISGASTAPACRPR